jgi:hypothetical protein
MSNLETLLNRLAQDITQKNEHFVYYDDKTKRINKISPVCQKSNDSVITVATEKVEPILRGTNKLDDYIVYFDYSSKSYSVQKRKQDNASNIFLTEIVENFLEADLTLHLNESTLSFKLNEQLIDYVTSDKSYLVFVVTEANNPYKLYNKFDFKASELVNNIDIKHHLTTEQINFGVSIYTNKIFDNYNLKVNYDNKI